MEYGNGGRETRRRSSFAAAARWSRPAHRDQPLPKQKRSWRHFPEGAAPDLTCRVYAPVGGYADLLAYLVRRLLENGANSSFVSAAADPDVPVETILRRPQSWIDDESHARHSHIPLPRNLFEPDRRNSTGVEFGDGAALAALLAEIKMAVQTADARALIDG